MSAEWRGHGDSQDGEQERITEAIRDIAANRSVIDQAKGMLMVIYGVDAEGAFGLLRWQSQQHNVRLRLLAEQLTKDLVELARDKPPLHRIASDNVLLTAHQRVADVAARQLDGRSKADD